MKIRDNVKPSLPPIPGGNYLGICVYSIAIGEQLCEYEGKSKNYYKQVMLGFEICGQTIEIDGKQEPRVLGKTFNSTLCRYLREQNLSKCREIWLLHLSDATSREWEFVRKVRSCVPNHVRVEVCGR